MAYTNAPTVSTYSQQPISMCQDIHLRPAASANNFNTAISQDAGMINMLPFKLGEELVSETRMAIEGTTIGSTFVGTMRGLYVWEKTAGTIYYFCVVDTSVYTSTDGVAFTAVDTLLTNVSTPVRFTEFIDATNVKKLVLVDGVEGYVYTTNAAGTKIVDADFPTPHVPFPVFIDGYLFLAKAGTGDIYNSDLNDPAIWTAGSFISSEMYPDDIQTIVKINDYLVAIGTQSCEYFYDAANATASPLARVEGLSLPFGCLIPNSIAVNKDTVVMIANNNDGQGTLVRIEGQKYEVLETKFVIPLLNGKLRTGEVSISTVRGCFFRQRSSLFYLLCFGFGSNATRAKQPSFVYSFDTKMWVEFAYTSQGTDTYPVNFSSAPTTIQASTYVAGNLTTGVSRAFFAILSETAIGDTANGTAVANTGNIYWEIRTDFLDFGTLNRKTMNRLGIAFEVTNVVGLVGSSVPGIDVSVIDDDTTSTTWTSVGRVFIPVAGATAPTRAAQLAFPFITQLGTFRRRALKFSPSLAFPSLRIHSTEVDINKGQQ